MSQARLFYGKQKEFSQITDTILPATFDPNAKGTRVTLSNGNLTLTHSSSGSDDSTYSQLTRSSPLGNKYYVEMTVVTYAGGGNDLGIGIDSVNTSTGTYFYSTATGYAYYFNGQKWNNNAGAAYGNSFTTGDVIGIAIDMDNRYIYFSKNGTWQNSGDPTSGATGTGKAYTFTAGTYYIAVNTAGASVVTANFGASAFAYSIPSGYIGTW